MEIILISLFLMFDKTQRSEWLHWDHQKTKTSLFAFLLFAVLINLDSQGFQPFWQVAAYEVAALVESATYGGSARYSLWNSASQMIRANPLLGTGLGSFFENFNHGYLTLGTWNIRSAHNDVLQLIVELGIFGFLIFLALVLAVVKAVLNLAHKSSGPKRLAYAATFVALAGTSINAQLSFPYQLQVPFILLTLYLALLIKGNEEHTPRNELKVIEMPLSIRPRIVGFTAATIALLLVTTINLQWFRLYNDLSNKFASNSPKIFEPASVVFHKDLIPILRSLSVLLHQQGEHYKALSLTPSLLTYWPEVAMNAILRADHYVSLRNYEEAERLVKTVASRQPADSYFAEHILINVYKGQNQSRKLWETYQRLASEPENSLRLMQKNYLTLHFLSVKFKDYSKTQLFYDKYLKYFSTTSELESNMVTFFMNTEQEERAIPHMIKALELNPQVHNAEAMNFFLKNYSN